MKRRERANIVAALNRSNGRIHGSGGAAKFLCIRPTTLSARIKKLQPNNFNEDADARRKAELVRARRRFSVTVAYSAISPNRRAVLVCVSKPSRR